MKKTFKLIALSLGIMTFTCVGLTSCQAITSCNGINKIINSIKGIEIPETDPEYVYDGTHIYTANDTNDYLLRNGKTEYKLVIPSSSSSPIRVARTEFVDLFKEATGITIDVVTDTAVTNASQGKFISLGYTSLLENSGINIDYNELTADGHRIVTKGDDIYLCGGADEGTVFAVYTFMNLTFNYETYYYDCMEIEHATEKKLKNYDVTDIPDFKYRAHSTDVTCYESTDYAENMFAWRLKYYGKEGTRGYFYMPVHEYVNEHGDLEGKASASTNARRWFPEHIYKEDHPEWFSDNGGQQLCFSAHGDAESYGLMLETAFRKVEAHLKYYTPDLYPRYKIMTLTHEDNMNYCTCSKCAELSSYYGDSQAAVQILFMNDLAERVDELLENNKDKDWYREDFKLLFFAYNHNYVPPARYDAVKKEYVPIDDKVRIHDRVIAWFCREGDGQIGFDVEGNTQLKTTLAGWSALADHIFYWSYGTNFRNYMYPIDSFQYATSEMFAYFCNQSDDFWFTQYQDGQKCANTAWHNLKAYLDAKLSWDTSLDTGELIEKWMNAMYKDAAPTIMNLFQTIRSYQRHVLIGIYQQGGGEELSLAQYWPIGAVEGWLQQIEKAKSEVARFEVLDPELHDKLLRRIEAEAISYLFIMLDTHGFSISKEDRAEYINRLKYDIEWMDLHEMEVRNALLKDWLYALV